MRIEIESLTLINFKGQRQRQVKFEPVTNISGANATGKTTIFDSFLWLLFGKDSTDRKDFGIKTLDENGKAIPMIEHEVIGKLRIWDSEDAEIPRTLILKRTLREKWVKARGKAESEFTGNETVYNVDMVPCTMKEYNDKVDSLCKESLFKLLTNPAYFPELNWTAQRQSLFNLIPAITNDEIIAAVPDKAMKQGKFSQLLKIITAGKTMEDYRKQIANDIRRLKDELVLIPARIDEILRGLPEAEDWTEIEKKINDTTAYITRKNEEKTNRLASVEEESKKRADKQANINSLKQQMTTIKYSVEDAIRENQREKQKKKEEHDRYMSDYESLISKATGTLNSYKIDMEALQRERASLLEEWKEINSRVYDLEARTTCPVCKQELPTESIEMEKQVSIDRFKREKAFALEQNTKKGKNTAGQIKVKEEQITEATAKIEKLRADLEAVRKGWEGDEPVSAEMGAGGVSPAAISFVTSVDVALNANEEYKKLKITLAKEIEAFEKLGPIAAVDISDLDKEIAFAETERLDNRTRLMARDLIAKVTERKIELEASQKKLSQEIAGHEQMEFTIETFIRTKVTMLEQRINSMFSLVKFKMFDLQINGQLAETCECSIGGVPYSDLNNAAQINAGIDIINTMSKAYGVIAPIWIDNRESVNEIIPTKAQLINLYVTTDPQLIIN